MEDFNEVIDLTINNYYKAANKAAEERDNKLESILLQCSKLEDCNIKEVAVFARLNKQNTLNGYFSEIEKGECYDNTAVCTKRLTITNENLFEWFCSTLLNHRDFISGTGGCDCDDPRIKQYKNAWEIPREIAKTLKWYLCDCIVVNNGECDVFIIDAQGYDYARYIGVLKSYFDYKKRKEEESEQAYYNAYCD